MGARKKSFVVALIGGIASGKSTIAHILQDLGAQVLQADAIVHALYAPSGALYQPIIDHFGSTILAKDSTIDRAALKHIIAECPEEKAWLENLVHPLVRQIMHALIKNSKAPLCVIEIPLLQKRIDYPLLDYVIYVSCDPEEQCRRLMKRNHLSYEEAQKLLTLSLDPVQQKSIADITIDTTQLSSEALHHQLLAMPFASFFKKSH